MTHEEACDALRDNALDYGCGIISSQAWCARVIEILAERYPRERDRLLLLQADSVARDPSIRTGTRPATLPREASRPGVGHRAL